MNSWERAVLATANKSKVDETDLDRKMHLRQRQIQQEQWNKSIEEVKQHKLDLKENPEEFPSDETSPSWSDVYLASETEEEQIKKILIQANLYDSSVSTAGNVSNLLRKYEAVHNQLATIKGII